VPIKSGSTAGSVSTLAREGMDFMSGMYLEG
jgi:hypothetical protein